MTRITVLPHAELCPEGAAFEARPGQSVCESLLENGVGIEHACEMSCACATCHILVREGFDALAPSGEQEDDLLDMVWGLEPCSRLACRTFVNETPLVIEIPRYSVNGGR